MVFNATFNKISVTSWRSVLLVEETGGPGPGENTDLSQVTDELYHIMLYTLSWSRFELTSVVISTDYIDRCKSNYHTITATTAPFWNKDRLQNIQMIVKAMGFTYPIPDRWRMCTISYSISRWRTAISCGQCRSSNMIYYAEIHRQTFEKLTWLKGTYYTENPSIRFMFVTFQYYCICWMSKLPRLKRKHH
jgi:hypothetical protein